MTKSFNCASCSAPLEFEGKTMQKCRFCGCTVIAPPEMFYAASAAPFGDLSSLTGRALKIAEIDRLIHSGNKIEAIKVFRETFGVGLAEAKEAVERMARGESVDISGMQVRTAAPTQLKISPETIDAVKKAGATAGVFSLVIVLIILFITVASVGVGMYFAFAAADRSATSGSTGSDSPSERESAATELLKIGGEGNGIGRFKDNRHVAVDGKGRIYSSDYSPQRIQVFDAEGKFINQWNPAVGSNLYGLAADREGNVYIANDKGLFKHEGESGKLLAKAENTFPRSIASTWDGKVVAISGKTLMVFDKDLKKLSELKDAAEMMDSIVGFGQIAVDGEGQIFATVTHKQEIWKFSAEGKFLDRFPNAGSGIYGIAIDPQGRIFISNVSEIDVLDPNGTKIKVLDANQAFGLAFDQAGDLYVASRPHVIKEKLNF